MRRGIVLFITLAILLMLSGVIFLFLHQSGVVKKSVRQNIALVQTNLILNDMSGYLKSQNFTQDDIFYGAGIPVALDLGPVNGMFSIDSADRTININAYLKSLEKEQVVLETFLQWLDERKIKDPQLLLALLLDTMDKDLYPRIPGSEIRRTTPWFQNGSIPNRAALETVLSVYRQLSGDTRPDTQRWEEIFGFEGSVFDLNYAGPDQLRLLFPNLDPGAVERIAAHNSRYEKAGDIPVGEELQMELLQPHAGITPVLSTREVAVHIDYTGAQECSGSLTFRMGLKKKKITRLTLSTVRCP
ncbi:hypothetical protein [Hydrogenimonas sp. SS33]|uniref:hypothetical protein n=1 Tax=Hydrogenimonas leucolamina TaxID=2954236 RepID=UPI00336C1639